MGRAITDADRQAIKAMLTARPKPRIRTRRIISREAPKLRKKLKWPHVSDALGVSPDKIPEAREAMRRQGLPIEFTADGRAIITGPDQYRKVARACGLWSGRDGYEAIGNTGKRGDRLRREVNELVREVQSGPVTPELEGRLREKCRELGIEQHI